MPFDRSSLDTNSQGLGQAFNTVGINSRVFLPIIGPDVNGSLVEADHQILLLEGGTVIKIGVVVSGNTRADDTQLRFKINGLQSLTIIIPAGVNGVFSEEGIAPVLEGDLINWESVELGATGGGYTLNSATVLIKR